MDNNAKENYDRKIVKAIIMYNNCDLSTQADAINWIGPNKDGKFMAKSTFSDKLLAYNAIGEVGAIRSVGRPSLLHKRAEDEMVADLIRRGQERQGFSKPESFRSYLDYYIRKSFQYNKFRDWETREVVMSQSTLLDMYRHYVPEVIKFVDQQSISRMRALVDATVAISACATTYSAIMGPSGCLYPDDPNAVAPSDNYSMDAFSLELEPGMKKEKSARYAKGTKAFMRGQNISGKSEVVGLNEASLSLEQESDLIGRVIERRKNPKKKDKNPKRKDSGPFNLTGDLSETDDDDSIESYISDGEPNTEGDYLEGTPIEAKRVFFYGSAKEIYRQVRG